MNNQRPKKNAQLNLARLRRALRRQMPLLRERYKVASLGVFGSYARGTPRVRSDLDLLVEFNDPRLTLLKLIEMENYLSDTLGVKVDLVEKSGLKPRIGDRILREVVPV